MKQREVECPACIEANGFPPDTLETGCMFYILADLYSKTMYII